MPLFFQQEKKMSVAEWWSKCDRSLKKRYLDVARKKIPEFISVNPTINLVELGGLSPGQHLSRGKHRKGAWIEARVWVDEKEVQSTTGEEDECK